MTKKINPKSLANLNPSNRYQGKQRFNTTLLPETISWLQEGGNASQKIEELVQQAKLDSAHQMGKTIEVSAMNRPKGGRGHAAPYSTKLVRIPTPMESQVSALIDRYHNYINAGGNPLNPPVMLDQVAINTLKELEMVRLERNRLEERNHFLEQENAKIIDNLVELERLYNALK